MSLRRSLPGLAFVAAILAALTATGPAGADAGGSLELHPASGPAGATVTLTEGVVFPTFVCGNGDATPGSTFQSPYAVTWSLRRGSGTVPQGSVFGPQDTDGTEVASGRTETTPGQPISTQVTIPADATPGSWFFVAGDCVDANDRVVFGYTFAFTYVVEGTATEPTVPTSSSTPGTTPTTAAPAPGPAAPPPAAPVAAAPAYTG